MKKLLLLLFIHTFFCKSYGQITFEKMYQSLALTGQGRSVLQATDGGYITAGYSFHGSTQGVFVAKTNSNGQLQWVKRYGIYTGGVSAQGYSINYTSDGGYILAGSINNALPITGNNDLLLMKIDFDGNLIWSKLYGSGQVDIGYDAIESSDGGYIITGYTTITPGSNDDILLIKTDSVGNSIWRKTYGGLGVDQGQCVLQNNDGSYFLGGRTNGFGAVNTDFFLIKTDGFGDTLWSRRYGSGILDNLRSMEATNDGGLILTGESGGGGDFYIVKTDSIGNIVFARQFNGGTIDYCWAGKQTNDGGYIFAGSKHIALVGTVNDMDVMLIKTNSNGDTTWTKAYGGPYVDEGYDVQQTSDGGYIISGVRALTTPSFLGENHCAYLIKTDSLGNTSCSQSYGTVSVANVLPTTSAAAPSINSPVLAEAIPPLMTYTEGTETVYCFDREDVWPGDADNDDIVDNNDLLPIGLYYSNTGYPRAVVSNVWQSDSSANWGITQSNASDIKHADCNGDGMIDLNDTLAIDLNFNLTHSFAPESNEQRLAVPDIYIVTSNSSYLPGALVSAEVWLGTSVSQVSDLYGIAFNINYDGSLVQPSSEELIYPISWLGTPGTNAIKIGKIDPLANVVYCAETRINHTNADGYGKIAEFSFQTLSSISVPTTMNFSISSIANDSAGAPILFNPQPYSILINPLGTNIDNVFDGNGINIFPNPYSTSAQIIYSLTKKSSVTIEVYNGIGQKIGTLLNAEQSTGEYKYSFGGSDYGYGAGVYFVKFIIDGKVTMKKLVEIK